MKKRWRYKIGFLIIAVTLLTACSDGKEKEKQIQKSLFSWNRVTITEDKESLFTVMKAQEIPVLYQHFSQEMKEETLVSFCRNAAERGILLYALYGQPEWALEESGEGLEGGIKHAVSINEKLTQNSKIKGIMFDVEPYLLSQWDEDSAGEIMKQFVNNMRQAYEMATENEFEVILCIPYFYDTKGFEEQLEELIAHCCDKVAVMNYYQGAEKEHMETEAALAEKYGKGMVNIYELQSPGEHDLTDKNTYYEEGLDAAAENFRTLLKAFPELELSMGLHDYKALKEVTERE